MKFDFDGVRANIKAAATDDLLDRVTVYRDDMEPVAVDLCEAELRTRGIRSREIENHAMQREEVILRRSDGSVRRCSYCHRPAQKVGQGWHKLWGKLPLFPRVSPIARSMILLPRRIGFQPVRISGRTG